MALNTKDFVTLVRDQATAVQGAAGKLVDFTVGSVLRAIVEANAGVALWLQGLILQLLSTTRAATSSGADLDSFVNDFGVTRLPATAASGTVTFSRNVATSSAFIPTGTLLKTSDQTPETFTVVADATNPAYSSWPDGYTIPSGTLSLLVPVAASEAGTAANVLAGQCNVLAAPIPGVDSVSNASAFANGQDAEADDALRTRFVNYLASLSKATKPSIGFAIASVQPGLSYTITENTQPNGTLQYGYFSVIVDDGSGNPPASLLSAVYNAIDAVRPITSVFGVAGPTVVYATVGMTIAVAAPYSKATVGPQVAAALAAYIDSLPLGAALPYTRLAQIAYDTSPGITNVTGVLLSSFSAQGTLLASGTADLNVSAQQVIKVAPASIAATPITVN